MHSASFTSSGTWTCPAGVSAVFLTMVGGGGATPGSGDGYGASGNTGGAGSAELVVNRLVAVSPGTIYTVTVGSGGLGTGYNVKPGDPSSSSFAGFIALRAGVWNPGEPQFPGAGGFSRAGQGGGVGAAPAGEYTMGKREACGYTSGASGSRNTQGPMTLGGATGAQGIKGAGTYTLGGYPGSGAIWGSTNGGNQDGPVPSADPTHYGAGAGGSGSNSNGGNGAPGYVLLMW